MRDFFFVCIAGKAKILTKAVAGSKMVIAEMGG